jgi:site-specific DNA recombinase
MTALGAQRPGKPHRVQCAGFRESGTGSNGRKVSRSAIEALVFEGLRDKLAHPEAIAEYVQTYNEERRRLARQNGDQEKHLTRRAGEIARELDLVDAIAKGIGDLDTIGPLVKALQQERDQLKAQLAAAMQSNQVVSLHPAAVTHYLADIKRLADVAADAAALDEPELVATLRSLIEAIIVHAPANSDDPTVEIRASPSELMMAGPLVRRTGSGDRWWRGPTTPISLQRASVAGLPGVAASASFLNTPPLDRDLGSGSNRAYMPGTHDSLKLDSEYALHVALISLRFLSYETRN